MIILCDDYEMEKSFHAWYNTLIIIGYNQRKGDLHSNTLKVPT